MSDTTIDDQISGLPDASRPPIEASIVWRVGRPAPDVVLEFDGIETPTAMLGSLASLGWEIPALPAPPRTAIEWVPDPVAGTNHTIKPWRVTAFMLGAGDWDRERASAIAVHTLAVLQRNGASIDAPDSLMTELGPIPDLDTSGTADPSEAQTASASLTDGGAPHVIAIAGIAVSHPAMTNRAAIGGGRDRVDVVWAESTVDLASTLRSDVEVEAVGAESLYLWAVRYATTPKLPGIGYVPICAVVPDTAPDDKKLGKVVAGLGGSIQIAELVPLNPARCTGGSLVFGITPAKTAEIASSTLRLKCKSAIVRIEPA